MHARKCLCIRKTLYVVLLLAIVLQSTACTQRKKVALLIANSDYEAEWESLEDVPPNDVRTLGLALREIGFKVTSPAPNLGYRAMNDLITSFRDNLRPQDIAIVYYSGHGVRVDNETFYVPVDAPVPAKLELMTSKQEVEKVLVKLSAIVHLFESARSYNILFFNACRNNLEQVVDFRSDPIEANRTTVAFAAIAGTAATNEPAATGNSPYTDALVSQLGKPGRTLREILKGVEEELAAGNAASDRTATYYTKTGLLDDDELVLHLEPAMPRYLGR
jgi:uncharacterized caspase-like protein